MTNTGSGDEVSTEARMIAVQAQRQAASRLSADELASLAVRALECEGPERREAVRGLARKALAGAQEVSFLLGQLAGLLDEGGEPHVQGR